MSAPAPIDTARLRKLPSHFAWVDRRLRAWLPSMSWQEMALCFFLHLAADRNGVSFYADLTMARILGMREGEVVHARLSLRGKGLIAYRFPYYQVLEVPCSTPNTGPKPVACDTPRA